MNNITEYTARETPATETEFYFDAPTLPGGRKLEVPLVVDVSTTEGACEICVYTEMCLTDHDANSQVRPGAPGPRVTGNHS